MHKTPPILDNGHHPEYARGIREAAEVLRQQYDACFAIALGGDRWSEEWRKEAATKGLNLLGGATNILAKIGEEPFLITEEKRRRLEAEAGETSTPPA